MRHFIALTLAPLLLASRVAPRSAPRALVAGAGTPARLPPRHRGTLPSTKYIAAIAAPADAYRHAAAPAAI